MRGNRRLLFVGLSAAGLCGLGEMARASLVAADQSSNYSGYENCNGLNYGSGFGTWVAGNTSGGTGGEFTYPSDLTAVASGGGFDVYDNGIQGGGAVTDEYACVRPFTGALAAGQDFSFIDELNNGSNPSNGGPSNLGFSLENSAGTILFDFHVQGGGPGYLLTDATQTDTVESNVGYNYQQIDSYNFTLNSVGPTTAAYTFTVSGSVPSYGGPPLSLQTFTGTISMATGGISQVEIYNNNGGQGSDLEFDNLAITNVPEPVSLAAMGLCAAPLFFRRRGRQR